MENSSKKILAYVSTLENFRNALGKFGQAYYDNSVVFIGDTQQVYTHGVYFDGGGMNWSVIEDGILAKGEERFNIWYCSKEEFESYSNIASGVLSIVNYIITSGINSQGVKPGTQLNGKRLWKGDEQLQLVMDEMILEKDVKLSTNVKIVPDTLPGVLKQLFIILKYNTPSVGGDEYWIELGGPDEPEEPEEPENMDIIFGDVDVPNSAITKPPQTWGTISQPGSSVSSTFWNKLFRWEQK